jgi:hypothetical protein
MPSLFFLPFNCLMNTFDVGNQEGLNRPGFCSESDDRLGETHNPSRTVRY